VTRDSGFVRTSLAVHESRIPNHESLSPKRQIPHVMPQAMTAALEAGDRTNARVVRKSPMPLGGLLMRGSRMPDVHRALRAFAPRKIANPWRDAPRHSFLNDSCEDIDKRRLDESALVVALLVPRVRKKNVHRIDTGVRKNSVSVRRHHDRCTHVRSCMSCTCNSRLS